MRLSDKNRLTVLHPQLAAEWDAENTKSVELISVGSNIKARWTCRTCGYRWKAVVAKRTAGRGCPKCSGKRVLTDRNRLSILRPDISAEWGDRNKRTPDSVSVGSNVKVWWTCRVCGYSWRATVGARCINGKGCRQCAGHVLTDKNSLTEVRPDLTAEWADKKDINTVQAGSGFVAWWKCKVCAHEWQAAVYDRVHGCGCLKCRWAPTDENRLTTVCPELMLEWGDENTVNPASISFGSHHSALWTCKTCNHRWQARTSHRSSGEGCPACADHGYHVTKPGHFYIQRILAEPVFLKFGITNNDPTLRLQQQQRSSQLTHILIESHYFDDGSIPQQIENEVKKRLKDCLDYARQFGFTFDGSTETVPEGCLSALQAVNKEILQIGRVYSIFHRKS